MSIQDNNESINCNGGDIEKLNSDDEENDEIVSIDIRNDNNYSDMFSNNKGIKRNGRGSWCGLDAKAELVKKEKTPNLIMTRLEYKEMMKFNERKEEFMNKCNEFKLIYDISKHKNGYNQLQAIERQIINKFHIPLDYAEVVCVASKNDGPVQFVNLSVGGKYTQEIIRFLLPHLSQSYDVDTINGRPSIANLTLTNIIDPNEKITAFTGNGKKEDPVFGGIQADLTNTMHFGRAFEFLKAIEFPRSKLNAELLRDALKVLQKFKGLFTRVHTDYIKVFNYALDSILFQYISRGLIPPHEFDLELLKNLFNPEKMYNSPDLFIQENDKNFDINNLLKFSTSGEMEKTKEKETNIVSVKIPKDLVTIKAYMDNYCNALYVNNMLPKGVIFDELDDKEAKKKGVNRNVNSTSKMVNPSNSGTSSSRANANFDSFYVGLGGNK